jgi:hypothetical protein
MAGRPQSAVMPIQQHHLPYMLFDEAITQQTSQQYIVTA